MVKNVVAHTTHFSIFLKVAEIFVKAFPNPEDIRVPLREKYHSLQQRLGHCVVKGTVVSLTSDRKTAENSHIFNLLIFRERGREREGNICSTYLCTHWLLLV